VEGSSRDIIFCALWMGRGKDLKPETLGARGEIQNQYSPNTGSSRVTLLEKQWVLHLNYRVACSWTPKCRAEAKYKNTVLVRTVLV
jgi:hypothetical protein